MSTQVYLTPVQATAYVTLVARARDCGLPQPILGDSTAAAVAARLGSAVAVPRLPTSVIVQTALRTKMLDAAVRRFVAAHADAVVVDLGAGLDGSRERIAPPASVDWYDVDFPEVLALREDLLPAAALGHPVGVSLADRGWSATIPADRPTILFANGLFAFLTHPRVVALVREITKHFQNGELAFNDYGRLGASTWLMKAGGAATRSLSDLITYPGFNDARDPQRWAPRLRLVEETSLATAPEVALFPPVLRTVTRLSANSAALARRARILRYRF